MCHKRADNFLPRHFLFFFGKLIQIWVSELKLGHVMFSQVAFCCGMTPYLI